MKIVMQAVAWGALLLAVVYFTVGARYALLYENPVACLAIALIGMGLCLDARRKETDEKAGKATTVEESGVH